MAVRTKDELLTAIKSRLGDDASDDAIALIEDVTDTIGDFESRTSNTEDWKSKYEENDRAWRTKYRDRFFNTSTDDGEGKEDDSEKPVMKRFEDLFK